MSSPHDSLLFVKEKATQRIHDCMHYFSVSRGLQRELLRQKYNADEPQPQSMSRSVEVSCVTIKGQQASVLKLIWTPIKNINRKQ